MKRIDELKRIIDTFGYKGNFNEISKGYYRVDDKEKYLIVKADDHVIGLCEKGNNYENALKFASSFEEKSISTHMFFGTDPHNSTKGSISNTTLVPNISFQSAYFDKTQEFVDPYSYEENDGVFFAHLFTPVFNAPFETIKGIEFTTDAKSYIKGVNTIFQRTSSDSKKQELIRLLRTQRNILITSLHDDHEL